MPAKNRPTCQRSRRFLPFVLAALMGIYFAPAAEAGLGKRIASRTSDLGVVSLPFTGVKRPKTIYVRVTSSLPQSVEAQWNILCTRGHTRGRSVEKKTSGRTTLTRRISLPRPRRPDRCSVEPTAQALQPSDPEGNPVPFKGTITITLYATKRKG